MPMRGARPPRQPWRDRRGRDAAGGQCRLVEHQVPAVRPCRRRPAGARVQGSAGGDRHQAASGGQGCRRHGPDRRDLPPDQAADLRAALGRLEAWLVGRLGGVPRAIGHRVVHGGPDFAAPTLVDDAVLDRLEQLVPLAPLHQPNNLAPIRQIRANHPDIPQVACFDTAFHRDHPEVADRFAIADAWYQEGVRRYGFHGLSYEYIAGRLQEIDPSWRKAGWRPAILAPAPRCVPSMPGAAWTARWASPPSTVCRWAPAPGSWTQAWSSTCCRQRVRRRAGRAVPLPRWRPQGAVRHQQRRPRPAGQRRARCGTRARLPGLPDRPRGRCAGGRDGRDRRHRVHRRHRRAQSGDTRAGHGASALARLRARPGSNERHGPLISTTGSRRKAYVIPTDEEQMIARHTLAC